MLEKRGLTAYGLHVKSLVTDEKGKPILDEHGKKKYRLHQSVISKIKNNKSKALQLDILSVLCELLDCQPADLMIYESTTTQSAKHTQSDNTTQSATDNEPPDVDMSKYYTPHKLKERGWTTVLLLSLLGNPDFTKVRGGKNPQELYLVSRVEAMEKTKKFAEFQKRKIKRAANNAAKAAYIASTTQFTKQTQSVNTTQSDNTTQSASDNERLLTTADIAERLELSKKSVTDYINKGTLPTIQPKGKGTPHFVKESDYPAFELYYRNLTGKQKP